MSEIKNYGPYIGEDDYKEKMDTEVVPYLNSRRNEGYMETYDGHRLRYLYFLREDPVATVNIFHGKGEFFEKYEEMIYYLLREGYNVFFLEQRGFAKSDRMTDEADKVHVESFDDYVKDQWDFFWQVVNKYSNTDVRFILAHSMGGLVSTRFMEVHPQCYRAAVLASPMMGLKYGIPKFVVKMLAWWCHAFHKETRYAPKEHGYIGMPDFEHCSDRSPARYDRYKSIRENTPDYHTAGVTYGWIRESLIMEDAVMEEAENASVPIILMQAGCDETVDLDAQMEFAAYAKDTLVVSFPDSKHEIYAAGEEERTLFYDWIFSFYESTLQEIRGERMG